MAITIPTPDLSALKGKRTYITIAVGIACIWLDHFYGTSFTDTCKSAVTAPTPDVGCTLTTQQAIGLTWAAIVAAFMRASNPAAPAA